MVVLCMYVLDWCSLQFYKSSSKRIEKLISESRWKVTSTKYRNIVQIRTLNNSREFNNSTPANFQLVCDS